jgi:hypothetical protein
MQARNQNQAITPHQTANGEQTELAPTKSNPQDFSQGSGRRSRIHIVFDRSTLNWLREVGD